MDADEEEGPSKTKNPSGNRAGSRRDQDKVTSAEARQVLESHWLASQKNIINSKLIAAQQEKKRRKTDEKAAAIQLERTVMLVICCNAQQCFAFAENVLLMLLVFIAHH